MNHIRHGVKINIRMHQQTPLSVVKIVGKSEKNLESFQLCVNRLKICEKFFVFFFMGEKESAAKIYGPVY